MSNQSRGLLSEFGVVFLCGHKALLNGLSSVIDNSKYSHRLQDMVIDMLSEYEITLKRLKYIEKQLGEFVDASESGKILRSILGIGVINSSAFLAAIGKGQAFNSPKESAVWLGLMPKQHTSGNISKIGDITKCGNRYLRKQIVISARAFVSLSAKSTDH